MTAEQNSLPAKAIFRRLAWTYLSTDNVSMVISLALITRGAAHWGEGVAYLTCGALVLGLTLLHLILGRRADG